MSKSKFWEFKNVIDGISADLYIYNEISSWDDEDITSAQSFKKDLDSIGNVQNVNLYINSPGGSVADGLCIASMIKRHPAKFTGVVDGMACSIASVIVDSCDVVKMYTSTMQMIHNASVGGFFYGNSKDFKKQAEDLDKITSSLRQTYLNKAGDKLNEEKLIELMDAESWLSAKECYELGLCDEIIENNKMVAKLDVKFINEYKNIPQELLKQDKEVKTMDEEIKDENIKEVEAEVQETIDENLETVEEIVEEAIDVVDDNSQEETISEEVVESTEDDNSEDKVSQLENEKNELANKLNEANQSILALNDKIEELQKVADLYNSEQQEKNKIAEDKLLNEKKDYYRNKFEKLGAKEKYESEEIQNLVNNCIKDKDSLLKLNQMVVDMISLDNKVVQKDIIEPVSKIENLIPEADGAEKYGFR